MYKKMSKIAPVFPLYKIRPDGKCQCGSPDCAVVGKHPAWGGWQRVERMSDDDYDDFSSLFKSSYGVLLKNLLVIDIDPRNGGKESMQSLMQDFPELAECGFAVETGRGDGGRHWYFSLPEPLPLRSALEKYTGIDFKSSGFVVGPDSLHASGGTYKVFFGLIEDICPAPARLIEALLRPQTHRVNVDGQMLDIEESQIKEMLSYINKELDYDDWIAVGMAINDALNGDGYELFDEFSSQSEKYDLVTTRKKWKSFKAGGGYSYGTLHHFATAGGWIESVIMGDPEPAKKSESLGSTINLSRPPGFVGRVTQWINDRCLYPRETLATASALHVVGAIAAMRYTDDYRIRTNLMTMGIADSGSGKNDVIKAVGALLIESGLAPATYGRIKSERDLLNNLYYHQCAHYYMDELGEQFNKVMSKNAASHNMGVVGTIMEVLTSANSIMPIEGAEKIRIKEQISMRIIDVNRAISENEDKDGRLKDKVLPRLERALLMIDYGIENPIMSLIGVASPVSISGGLDRNLAENGFIRRALLANESEANPRAKPGFQPVKKVPFDISIKLITLAGNFERGEPIEYRQELEVIPTELGARERLQEIQNQVWEDAEEQKSRSGLVAIAREVYHNTLRVSLILAIPGGKRTLEHVEWAYAYAKRNMEQTILLVAANDEKDGDAIFSKIMLLIDVDDTVKDVVIKQKLKRKHTSADVDEALGKLVEAGHLDRIESLAKNGRATFAYHRT